MKKTLLLSCIGLFLFNWLTSCGFPQSAEDILKKMIAARGGRKNLENVKDYTYFGSMHIARNNLDAAVTTYWKAPDKRRTDIEVMGTKISNVYDGKTAWRVNPQAGAQKLSEKITQFQKRRAMGHDVFLNPGKYGIKYTFKEKAKVKGSDSFVLIQSFPDGYQASIYVDSKTYLISKIKSKGVTHEDAEVDTEAFYSDYKEVNGMMVAHSILRYQEGKEYIRVTINKMNFNSGLEDSLFKAEK